MTKENMVKIFGEERVQRLEENEVVGYDNGNDHMNPIYVIIDDYEYTLTCDEYDCVYENKDQLNDMISENGGGWFVKAN